MENCVTKGREKLLFIVSISQGFGLLEFHEKGFQQSSGSMVLKP